MELFGKLFGAAAGPGCGEAGDKPGALKDSADSLRAAYANKQTGERFEFGRYPQGENGEVQPITWRVLRRDKDSLLVISELGLDVKPYHKRDCAVTWRGCTLRSWLNGEFLQKAFTEVEQSLIKTNHLANNAGPKTDDRVYLLSRDEAESLFADDNDRITKSTAYILKIGADTNDSTDNAWWLRSRGNHDFSAAYVNAAGRLVEFHYCSRVCNAFAFVRPAFQIAI